MDDKALAHVLRWEGGWTNHPNDKGGATNYGITQRVYNSYRDSKRCPRRDVRNITMVEVKDIYANRYWTPAGCEQLPSKIAMAVFDWAVNAGVGRAVKTLQAVVGAKQDGIFGKRTLNDVNYFIHIHGENELVRRYNDKRKQQYLQFAASPGQSTFLKGWLNRLNSLNDTLFDDIA